MKTKEASPVVEPSHKMPDAIDYIFSALDVEAQGTIRKSDILGALEMRGILEDDLRIKETVEALNKIGDGKISQESFRNIVGPNITLIERAMTGKLIIPDFNNFYSIIKNIYNRTILNKNGAVSDHIPELASIDPENYAISI